MMEHEPHSQNEILKRLLDVEREAARLEKEAQDAAEAKFAELRALLEETRKRRLAACNAECEANFAAEGKTLMAWREGELAECAKALDSVAPDYARFSDAVRSLIASGD